MKYSLKFGGFSLKFSNYDPNWSYISSLFLLLYSITVTYIINLLLNATILLWIIYFHVINQKTTMDHIHNKWDNQIKHENYLLISESIDDNTQELPSIMNLIPFDVFMSLTVTYKIKFPRRYTEKSIDLKRL